MFHGLMPTFGHFFLNISTVYSHMLRTAGLSIVTLTTILFTSLMDEIVYIYRENLKLSILC